MTRIKMMDQFTIENDGVEYNTLQIKYRKAVTLLQYLILEEGRPVPSQRLRRELWPAERSENPESALKTTVSRLRNMMNKVSGGLGDCVVSERGAYHWENQPEVSVDVLTIQKLLRTLNGNIDEESRRSLTEQLLSLYSGDLYLTGELPHGTSYSNWLHNEYLTVIYRYLDLLKLYEEYNHICEVCDKAAQVDPLDDQLHIVKMDALVNLNRTDQADKEYQSLIRRNRRMLDAEPSAALREGYTKLVEAGKNIRYNIDSIRNELMEKEDEQRGPFFCDYEVFKEVYNIYMRNLERLGSSMFLAVIMLGEPDDSTSAAKRESCMAALSEILKSNMRKGDIITRFSDHIYAMLLPTVTYSSGSMVMERLEILYEDEMSANALPFHTRIAPLGTMK